MTDAWMGGGCSTDKEGAGLDVGTCLLIHQRGILGADRRDDVGEELAYLLWRPADVAGRVELGGEVHPGERGVSLEASDERVNCRPRFDFRRGRETMPADDFVQRLPVTTPGDGGHEEILGRHVR